MKIAMEIPFNHLTDLSPYCDFDFALAHVVLKQGQGSKYVKFYKKQASKGRIIWVDNSAHELKNSLPIPSLIKAAKLIDATHIVAPEERGDHIETLKGVFQLKDALDAGGLNDIFKIVGVWQGYQKSLEILQIYCNEVALPFDRLRDKFLTKETCSNFHYFGFRTFDELKRFPPKSIDTSLPIRAVQYNIDLLSRERRPRTPLLDFESKLSDRDLEKVVFYIKKMREASGN